MARNSKPKTPSITQLLAVISEYNRAHELDLAELHAGAVNGAVKNDFLENLYLAASAAAATLRPVVEASAAVNRVPVPGVKQ